jgi:hypothetical protein
VSRVSSFNKLAASTIAEDLTIIGNVPSKGEFHLDDCVQGDIRDASLVLGRTRGWKAR